MKIPFDKMTLEEAAKYQANLFQQRLDGYVESPQISVVDSTLEKGSDDPTWTWGGLNHPQILKQFEEPLCRICGTEDNVYLHLLDGDPENILLSNMEWICSRCENWRYSFPKGEKWCVRPYSMVVKQFSFEYGHILPWHPGKCQNQHGHSGKLAITVRNRVNPMGVVMDFKELSALVNKAVIDKLDHAFLNNFIDNPTSERTLVWIWKQLEDIGLKGLNQVTLQETETSAATLTAPDILEAFGWDLIEGRWVFVPRTRGYYEDRG